MHKAIALLLLLSLGACANMPPSTDPCPHPAASKACEIEAYKRIGA